MKGGFVLKFSICSWTFGKKPIQDVIQLASDIGYDEIEIAANVEDYDWKKIKEDIKKYNINVRGLSGDAGWPNEATDMANPDIQNREKAINHFKQQIDAAFTIGAEYIVVSPSAPGKSTRLGIDEEDWKWAIDSIQKLAPYANDKGVQLIIEPLNRYESCILNTGEQAQQFIREVNFPNVKTMLDTFHMNIEETSLVEPFKKLGDDLALIHVADTNRKGIGYGRLPFKEIVEGVNAIGYEGTITVECLAPGPDPFEANKQEENMKFMFEYAKDSLYELHRLFNKQ